MINLVGDFSNLKAHCKNIHTPEDINEVSEIVRFANKQKLKIIPIGGGTGTVGGYSGEVDIGINFKNFSYIRKKGNTFVVGAGLRVGLFNKYLKELDLTVPMTEAHGALIGGSIAMDNPGKPYSDSGLEKYLKSIILVLPSGDVRKISKKNKKLFRSTIGGEGITGIIIEAEFKPIKIQNKLLINILFRPNDFDFLELFWNKILHISRYSNFKISRGVIFPLGMLQVRGIFINKYLNDARSFECKIDKILSELSYFNVCKFDGNIPIGEMIIDRLAKNINAKFKFFPAISQIDYRDKKLHDLLVSYIDKNHDVGLIEEISIGSMRFICGSSHVFNGRIPDFVNIEKMNGKDRSVYILNYGGSNICGGSHIAFIGNDLEKIKHHMKNIFKILHNRFPRAAVVEHKASIIRADQIKFIEGENGLKLRKELRNNLDPNKIMHTTAIQNIDETISKI